MERIARSNSYDSIPEVDFLKDMLKNELDQVDNELMSEYRRRELDGEMLPEPLLVEDKSRFVLFPIKHPDVSSLNSVTWLSSSKFEYLNL